MIIITTWNWRRQMVANLPYIWIIQMSSNSIFCIQYTWCYYLIIQIHPTPLFMAWPSINSKRIHFVLLDLYEVRVFWPFRSIHYWKISYNMKEAKIPQTLPKLVIFWYDMPSWRCSFRIGMEECPVASGWDDCFFSSISWFPSMAYYY